MKGLYDSIEDSRYVEFQTTEHDQFQDIVDKCLSALRGAAPLTHATRLTILKLLFCLTRRGGSDLRPSRGGTPSLPDRKAASPELHPELHHG